MLGLLKRLFVGRPLATTQMEEQRLSKSIALAVFSSDALSSTAYATEEILFVTALGASSLALGLSKLVPIAIVVCILLTIVIVSYRQVIFAYPNGGGAYIVAIVDNQDTHGPRTATEKTTVGPRSLLNLSIMQHTLAIVLARPSNVVFHVRKGRRGRREEPRRQRFSRE